MNDESSSPHTPHLATMAGADESFTRANFSDVNLACTRWLSERGLLGAQLDPRLAAASETARRKFARLRGETGGQGGKGTRGQAEINS